MSWTYIYWVIHYVVEEGQNDHFHLRYGVKLQEGKNDFRKMAASLFHFHTDW